MNFRSNALTLSLAAAAVLVSAGRSNAAAVTDSFDTYAGTTPTAIQNYTSPAGTWAQVTTATNQQLGALAEVFPTTATTPAADKAFDGTSYLRMLDPSNASNPLAAAKLTLGANAVAATGNGVNISFALRDDASLNYNKVYIFNAGGTSRANTLLQLGINSGGKFSYTSYSLISGVSTGTTTTLTQSATAGTWYLFNINYKLDANNVGTYSLTISDPSKPAGSQTVYSSTTDLSGVSSGLTGGTSVGIIAPQTSGTGVGSADLDALSISPVPEPASGAALGLGGLVMLRRRRKAAK